MSETVKHPTFARDSRWTSAKARMPDEAEHRRELLTDSTAARQSSAPTTA